MTNSPTASICLLPDEEDLPDAVLTKGREIAHLDRLYFECNDFDRAGDAILERH
ncbi:hypothetical protein IH992_26085, partial [Candidatus Poribacteria bacterium]|nr:hypothetical protein [Candidatus Poribacteria bacterium]